VIEVDVIGPLLFILAVFFLSVLEFELIYRLIFLEGFSGKVGVFLRGWGGFGKFVGLEFDADSIIFFLLGHGSFPSALSCYVF
jgi:hypothetical protein